MGEIIWKGLVRFGLVVVIAAVLYGRFALYTEWWLMFFFAVIVVVLYPGHLAYQKHAATIRDARRNPTCATCRHLAPREALCRITDEHITRTYTPCGGDAWELRTQGQ